MSFDVGTASTTIGGSAIVASTGVATAVGATTPGEFDFGEANMFLRFFSKQYFGFDWFILCADLEIERSARE